MKELVRELAALWGPPGREDQVREALAARVQPYADELITDPLGNLIARRGARDRSASGRRLLLTAHMDGPAGIVNHITADGLLQFAPVAGLSLVAARGQRVRFRGGLVGVLDGEAVDNPKDLQLSRSWVDIGASSREEALGRVAEGEMFVPEGAVVDLGRRLAGPNLDNRAGCAVLVQFLAELRDTPHEVYVAFTVQGRTSPHPRGVQTVAYTVRPDLAVSVDATPAEPDRHAAVKLGQGPALRLRDSKFVLRPPVRAALERAAAAAGIPWQPEVLAEGTSEGCTLQAAAPVTPAAVLGLPARYLGTPVEVMDPADLEAAVRWLLALAAGPLEGEP